MSEIILILFLQKVLSNFNLMMYTITLPNCSLNVSQSQKYATVTKICIITISKFSELFES